MEKEAFALRLAQLREKKGVSARDMSLSIGQNPGYIYNIESCKSSPSMTGFYYICEYLGVEPKAFFDTDNSNPTKIDAILQDLKRLDPKNLDLVASLVKALLQE